MYSLQSNSLYGSRMDGQGISIRASIPPYDLILVDPNGRMRTISCLSDLYVEDPTS